jgi:predicted hydrocarbon binding protein
MREEDFEKAWLAKFSRQLDEKAGRKIREKIMRGSEDLSMGSNREDVIRWSKRAMELLDSVVEGKNRKEIMTGCACQYPGSQLQEIREAFEKTRDVDTVYQMLQDQFESFLKDELELEDHVINEIITRGWGLAGIKKGNTITATKIPKSGYLKQYMEEQDPTRRRALYCHCPRVRDAVQSGVDISPTYCYCGAGFYKGIWEYVLQNPVEVELLKSVLAGNDCCEIAIYLPE